MSTEETNEAGQGSGASIEQFITEGLTRQSPAENSQAAETGNSETTKLRNEAASRRVENNQLKEQLAEAKKIVEQFNQLKQGSQSDLEKLQATTVDLSKQLEQQSVSNQKAQAKLRIVELGFDAGVSPSALKHLDPNSFSADDSEAMEQLKAMAPPRQLSNGKVVNPGPVQNAGGFSQDDIKAFLSGSGGNSIFGN